MVKQYLFKDDQPNDIIVYTFMIQRVDQVIMYMKPELEKLQISISFIEK